jgi:hypothetical protein
VICRQVYFESLRILFSKSSLREADASSELELALEVVVDLPPAIGGGGVGRCAVLPAGGVLLPVFPEDPAFEEERNVLGLEDTFCLRDAPVAPPARAADCVVA